MGNAVHTPSEAWSIYSAHLSSGRSLLLPEPEGLNNVWQRLSMAQGFHIRDWTDAYLVSFAVSAQCRMVSFDAGFAKYQNLNQSQGVGLDFLHLKPEPEPEVEN